MRLGGGSFFTALLRFQLDECRALGVERAEDRDMAVGVVGPVPFAGCFAETARSLFEFFHDVFGAGDGRIGDYVPRHRHDARQMPLALIGGGGRLHGVFPVTLSCSFAGFENVGGGLRCGHGWLCVFACKRREASGAMRPGPVSRTAEVTLAGPGTVFADASLAEARGDLSPLGAFPIAVPRGGTVFFAIPLFAPDRFAQVY